MFKVDIDKEIEKLSGGRDYELVIKSFVEFFEDNLSNNFFNRLLNFHGSTKNEEYNEVLLKNVIKRYLLFYYWNINEFVYPFYESEDEKKQTVREFLYANPRLFELDEILFCSVVNCSQFFYLEACSILRRFIEIAMKDMYIIEFEEEPPKNFKPIKEGNISKSRGVIGALLDRNKISDEEYELISKSHWNLSSLIHSPSKTEMILRMEADQGTYGETIRALGRGFRADLFDKWANIFCEIVEVCFWIISDYYSLRRNKMQTE